MAFISVDSSCCLWGSLLDFHVQLFPGGMPLSWTTPPKWMPPTWLTMVCSVLTCLQPSLIIFHRLFSFLTEMRHFASSSDGLMVTMDSDTGQFTFQTQPICVSDSFGMRFQVTSSGAETSVLRWWPCIWLTVMSCTSCLFSAWPLRPWNTSLAKCLPLRWKTSSWSMLATSSSSRFCFLSQNLHLPWPCCSLLQSNSLHWRIQWCVLRSAIFCGWEDCHHLSESFTLLMGLKLQVLDP